jgi:hypothetical protein
MELNYETLVKERDPALEETHAKFLNLVKPKNDHIKEKTEMYHEWIKSQIGPDNQPELQKKIFANTYVYKELRAQTRMLVVFSVVCVWIRDTHNFDEYDFSHYGKGHRYTKENESDVIPDPGCIERIGTDAVNKHFLDNYL